MMLRVIYIPGMQGEGPGDRWFHKGLIDAGLTDCQMFDWPAHQWMLNNLRDRDQHKRVGEELAANIRAQPDRPTALIGHSTGAMIILDALEHLHDHPVDQALLLSAAVSCQYDLSAAVGGARRLVNLYSPRDWLVLNLGTKLFGSADGQKSHCAGYSPFHGPGSDDPRLSQRCYDPTWWKSGHYGGHLGPLVFGRFARDVVAPMLRTTQQELTCP